MDLIERLKQSAVNSARARSLGGQGEHYKPDQFIEWEAAAEIARLRAQPTELEVANTIKDGFEKYSFATDIARAVLALFPKVQP